MSILSRYIVREHLGPFFFSLAVIMFVFVTKFVVQYIGKIFGKGLAFSTIIEFIYLNLAWMLALAVPMAVLVASLMAFGRLSADNEIIALKTSGINLYRTIRPALIAASLLAVLMVIYNDRVLPDFNHKARLMFSSIARKKPTLQLEEGIYVQLDKFTILVEEVERPLSERLSSKGTIMNPTLPPSGADKLKQVIIFDASDPSRQRAVVAKSGFMVFDRRREQLVFTLFDGEIHEMSRTDPDAYRRIEFARNVVYIPAPDMVFKRREDSWRGDREMNIAMMREQVQNYRNSIQNEMSKTLEVWQNVLPDSIPGGRKTLSSTYGEKLDGLLNDLRSLSRARRRLQASVQQLTTIATSIDYFERQVNKYLVEIHKKFSIPFACIVFVLIGAPLGIRARRGSLGVGMSFSVGFFLLYWACLIGGEELADRKLLSPFLAMWFPNIVVGTAGVLMTYRTVRETVFFRWDRLPRFLQSFFKGEDAATR
ncbi:MAG: YjgP/YjgQ family permease [Calditrichaeota bacterium]|nr:MAG: YjgP/YjgQ family permease [Calditrichota bacterium]